MIVNQTNEGCEIFSHSSHGLLAGYIANELNDNLKNMHWLGTLTAIIEHDDRQLDFNEKNYLSKSGMPLDFLQEKRTASEVIKRSKRLLFQAECKSTWVALLINYHLQYIYKQDAKEKKAIDSFLASLKKQEKQFCKLNNLKKKELHDIYQIMLFADRCSLILCQDNVPSASRFLEINNSIKNESYWIKELDSSSTFLTIEPWIFQNDNFSVHAEYKLLKQSSFSSNEEFGKEYANAEVKIKTWNFKKLK